MQFKVGNSGTLSLPSSTIDAAVSNGDMFYRSDIHAFKAAANGIWKTLAFADTAVVTGHILYVDKDSINATDTRTGISKYSQSIPFKTINAAAAVAANGDMIAVAPGVYVEHIITATSVTFLLYNATIQHNHATESTIDVGGLCRLSVIGFGACAVQNLGAGRAIYYAWHVNPGGVVENVFSNVKISTVGATAIEVFLAGCTDTFSFDRVHITGDVLGSNVVETTSWKFLETVCTGSISVGTQNQSGSTFIIERCRLFNIALRMGMRIVDTSFTQPKTAGWYILSFYPLNNLPEGSKVFFQNCRFTGNSLFSLFNTPSTWVGTSITRFVGCSFDLLVGGTEGFGMWQYQTGGTQHKVIISNCISNVDYATGIGYADMGTRARIINSSFDNEFTI